MEDIDTEDEQCIESLLDCLNMEPFKFAGPFIDLATLLFNITKGSVQGYSHLLHVLAETPDPFAHDPLKIWDALRKAIHPLAPFNMDTLHQWASRDNPEMYNALFEDHCAAELLVFGCDADSGVADVDETGDDKETA